MILDRQEESMRPSMKSSPNSRLFKKWFGKPTAEHPGVFMHCSFYSCIAVSGVGYLLSALIVLAGDFKGRVSKFTCVLICNSLLAIDNHGKETVGFTLFHELMHMTGGTCSLYTSEHCAHSSLHPPFQQK